MSPSPAARYNSGITAPSSGQSQQTNQQNNQAERQANLPVVCTLNSSDEASAPSVEINNNSQLQQQQQQNSDLQFYLKTSIFTKKFSINRDKLTLGAIKQLAIDYLKELYEQQQHQQSSQTSINQQNNRSTSNSNNNNNNIIDQLKERIILRIYDPGDESFKPFNAVSDIQTNSYIVIEISEKQLQPSTLFSKRASNLSGYNPHKVPHSLVVHSYKTPTYCDICKTLLFGLFRQGLKCEQCNQNFHKKCANNELHGDGCLPTLLSPNMSKRKSASNLNDVPTTTVNNNNLPVASNNNGHQNHYLPRLSGSGLFDSLVHRSTHHGPPHGVSSSKSRTQGPGPSGVGAGVIRPGLIGAISGLNKTNQLSTSHQNLLSVTSNGNSGVLSTIASNVIHGLGDNELSLKNLGGSSSASTSRLNLREEFFYSNDVKIPDGKISDALSDRHRGSSIKYRLEIPHTLVLNEIANNITNCYICTKLFRQGSTNHRCKDCKIVVHSKCRSSLSNNCPGEEMNQSPAVSLSGEPIENLIRSLDKSTINDQQQDMTTEDNDQNDVILNNIDNIPLQRLVQSVKHVKKPDPTKSIIETWLIHRTRSNTTVRRHYWRLDDTDITLYKDDSSRRYFKAIPIKKLKRVLSATSIAPPNTENRQEFSSDSIDRKSVELVSSQSFDDNSKSDVDGEMVITQSINPNDDEKKSSSSSSILQQHEIDLNKSFAFEVQSGSTYFVEAENQTLAKKWKQTILETIELAKKEEEEQQKQQNQTGSTVKTTITTASVEIVDNSSTSKTSDSVKHETQPTESPQSNISETNKIHQHQFKQQYRPNQNNQFNNTNKQLNRSRLANRRSIIIKLPKHDVPDHLIEGQYLIAKSSNGKTKEILGSGQFGSVYGAIGQFRVVEPDTYSGTPVAIKEICKLRFQSTQQNQLKNEADILSRLDHPGVIILDRVYDLRDKIYIIMEKLCGDMLEMILSSEGSKLGERVTKFLIYQILEALRYLHSKNIAHCDLKPENVLLTSNSQFPQIKLCDFGFAKIIEENSFRRSLVGTPAYLAPEVVKGQCYDRSLDLWSTGVIVYVSLSGTFPFTEREDIHDQISRASFMYPDDPWAKISRPAIEFINSLLKVRSEQRLSANKAQMHIWLQDFQLWCDLCDLEMQIGRRWLTDDSDYRRWLNYAKENKLLVPKSAHQLHDELNNLS